MKSRLYLALPALVALTLGAACGGSSEADEATATPTTATAIPTATPFASEPQPTIVAAGTPEATGRVTYVVEAGDTLSGIASRFETTVAAIMANNDIADPTLIFVGQELVIPTGESESAAETGGAEPAGGEEGISVYIVQAGDIAFQIAERFGTTLEALAQANDTTIDALSNIQPGDTLNLPRPR